jgi:hypothetical protein
MQPVTPRDERHRRAGPRSLGDDRRLGFFTPSPPALDPENLDLLPAHAPSNQS